MNALFRAIYGRQSSNPRDKVYAVAPPFKRRVNYSSRLFKTPAPIYDPCTSLQAAWEQLISSISSIDISESHLPLVEGRSGSPRQQQFNYFIYSPILQDTTGSRAGLKYSNTLMFLEIMILQVWSQQAGTTLYAYFLGTYTVVAHLSFDYQDKSYLLLHHGRQRCVTVPGIEVDFNSRSNYVLIDISPDHSLWTNSSEH